MAIGQLELYARRGERSTLTLLISFSWCVSSILELGRSDAVICLVNFFGTNIDPGCMHFNLFMPCKDSCFLREPRGVDSELCYELTALTNQTQVTVLKTSFNLTLVSGDSGVEYDSCRHLSF